jgi:hypothetical protein
VLVRICAGLAAACVSLDDQAAATMLGALEAADAAIALAGTATQARSWRAAQRAVADQAGAASVLAGRCTRLLLDTGLLTPDEAQQRLARALSAGGVAWLEGFLRGSGSLLLRDERLWRLIDEWLSGLGEAAFEAAMPLLRRAFSQFTDPERRQMGMLARSGLEAAGRTGRLDGAGQDDWDQSRVRRVLDVVTVALGGCVGRE